MIGYNDTSHYFVLASVLKKPMLQILISGCVQNMDGISNVLLLHPSNVETKTLSICTGHQMFHQLCLDWLSDGSAPPDKIGFWVCRYRLNPLAPLLKAENVERSGKLFQFATRRPMSSNGNKKVKLPFGLKMPTRKRKPRQTQRTTKRVAGAGGQYRNVSDGPGSSSMQVEHELDVEVHQFMNDELCDNESEPSSEAALECSCSSESDSDSTDDTDSDSPGSETRGEFPGEQHEQELFRQEQRVPETLFMTQSQKEENQEISKLEVAEEKRIESAMDSVTKSKTFCNSSLGVIGVSLQIASKLATCRHCLLKISKHSARFSYAWNLRKFHSYVHSECLVPHLQQEGSSLEQAKEFVTTFLQGDESTKAPECVLKAVQSVQKLLVETCPSSATSSSGLP